jgi:hypothetical protein
MVRRERAVRPLYDTMQDQMTDLGPTIMPPGDTPRDSTEVRVDHAL